MKHTKSVLTGLLAALALIGVYARVGFSADPFAPQAFQPALNSPAQNLVPVALSSGASGSDSADLAMYSRAIWVGGAGNLVLIGSNDGATLNGASSANAATLTIVFPSPTYIPPYSSAHPGQYIICADGTNAAEIISGYMTGATLTVTTGGGTGGNTCANAHANGTLLAAYAPLLGVNAGQMISVRARRVMNTNTTATSIVEVF